MNSMHECLETVFAGTDWGSLRASEAQLDLYTITPVTVAALLGSGCGASGSNFRGSGWGL